MEKQAKQDTQNIGYKDLMAARKEGLLVQSEREYRAEQYQVMQNHIRSRQNLFDSFYGGLVDQKQRNEYYAVIDRERRKTENERNAFYPKAVRKKMQIVRELLTELRELGVNEDSLVELLRPERPISRLYITADYRIFLPEFENKEVPLGPLPKSVFILFLRHPEGIVLKQIGDYFSELLSIYRVVMGAKYNELRAKKSLQRICNPLTNSLNEKISRIHEALRSILDDTVALHYFICGKKSEPKQILLPQGLVNWEYPPSF